MQMAIVENPVLNEDVLFNIFSRLEAYEDVKNTSEVCKQWRQFSISLFPTDLRKLLFAQPTIFAKVAASAISSLALHGDYFAYGRPGGGFGCIGGGEKSIVCLNNLKTREERVYHLENGYVDPSFLHLTEKNYL